MDELNRLPPYPRSIRPAAEPFGHFIRPARHDHKELLNFIATGNTAFSGLVFDPTVTAHRELRQQVLKLGLDAILDPKTQQAATVGAHTDEIGKLPWGLLRPHTPEDFRETKGRRLITALADYVVDNGYTQVLAPTHLLTSADDEWLPVDIEATHRLRDRSLAFR